MATVLSSATARTAKARAGDQEPPRKTPNPNKHSMPLLNHRTILKVAVALLATATFAACFDHTTFFNYHAIAPEGWDKPDFQEYNVDPIETDGYYVEEIGLRTSSAYPFRRIHLVVRQDQHVIPLKTLSLKAGDSLSVRISHDMSAFTLQGVSDVGLKVTRQ